MEGGGGGGGRLASQEGALLRPHVLVLLRWRKAHPEVVAAAAPVQSVEVITCAAPSDTVCQRTVRGAPGAC